jgi:hypothetical protein
VESFANKVKNGLMAKLDYLKDVAWKTIKTKEKLVFFVNLGWKHILRIISKVMITSNMMPSNTVWKNYLDSGLALIDCMLTNNIKVYIDIHLSSFIIIVTP